MHLRRVYNVRPHWVREEFQRGYLVQFRSDGSCFFAMGRAQVWKLPLWDGQPPLGFQIWEFVPWLMCVYRTRRWMVHGGAICARTIPDYKKQQSSQISSRLGGSHEEVLTEKKHSTQTTFRPDGVCYVRGTILNENPQSNVANACLRFSSSSSGFGTGVPVYFSSTCIKVILATRPLVTKTIACMRDSFAKHFRGIISLRRRASLKKIQLTFSISQ